MPTPAAPPPKPFEGTITRKVPTLHNPMCKTCCREYSDFGRQDDYVVKITADGLEFLKTSTGQKFRATWRDAVNAAMTNGEVHPPPKE